MSDTMQEFMQQSRKPKRTIILGSGGLRIGQAGEFDYSGTQAIKALKEEGIKTILINPNIATIQTSNDLADKVYLLPVTAEFVEKIIIKEEADSIILGFGGQTALNCGLELKQRGVLDRYGVQVLGTALDVVETTEDRGLFAKAMEVIDIKIPKSSVCDDEIGAMKVAEELGFPVMVRLPFCLGGQGSGIAYDKESLTVLLVKAFSISKGVLIEECLVGWKEIEYEVVRDSFDNCVTVCNMENFDPLGIHTGESIVVAPSQTLDNNEYHMLREIAIKAIRKLGIVGECNIQFALDPESNDYRVIEVNARLSRSSALASKATGYPLAFIAAKISLGKRLTQLHNSITKSTTACFEPALDYCVVKLPRWDMHKFKKIDKRLGSEMKSVGEVMAIGRCFEEALQKGIRMLHLGFEGLTGFPKSSIRIDDMAKLIDELKRPTDIRVFAIAQALAKGMSVDELSNISKIDRWYIEKINNIISLEKEVLERNPSEVEDKGVDFPKGILKRLKCLGFSDKQISGYLGCREDEVRDLRRRCKIFPFIKQIDSLSAEYPAKTNYLFMTYNASEHDVFPVDQRAVIVLGSGPYRIGSSVEFDWCCVNSISSAKKCAYQTIMINYNPETVSTDYDVCDKLYFEELSYERVLDIYEYENSNDRIHGIVVSMGGQIPNNVALPLYRKGVRILGTNAYSIDNAEDRHKFSKLLDELGIDQPSWKELTGIDEAKEFAYKVGYPVLIRPSYVLSGAAMNVVFDDFHLEKFLKVASEVSPQHPVVITKFEIKSKEIEIDAVASNGELVVWAISEHVENAGIHSGDATMILPPQNLYIATLRRIEECARKIAKALRITGPFNMQFLARRNLVKVIECNLRASRSFPFVSKVTKTNFISIATKVILGESIEESKLLGKQKPYLTLDYVGVKAPQFSFARLKGVDPIPTVEMASTGEVACLGQDQNEALLKAMIAIGVDPFAPEIKNVLVSVNGDENRFSLLDSFRLLEKKDFNLYATQKTSKFLDSHNIQNVRLHMIDDKRDPNILEYYRKRKIDLVICVPPEYSNEENPDGFNIRRAAVDHSVPLIANVQVAKMFVDAVCLKKFDDLFVKSHDEY